LQCNHWPMINKYYDCVVDIRARCITACVPKTRDNYYKSFWTDELSELNIGLL